MKVAKEKKKKQDDANPVILLLFSKIIYLFQLHQKTIEEDEKFENVRKGTGNRFEILFPGCWSDAQVKFPLTIVDKQSKSVINVFMKLKLHDDWHDTNHFLLRGLILASNFIFHTEWRSSKYVSLSFFPFFICPTFGDDFLLFHLFPCPFHTCPTWWNIWVLSIFSSQHSTKRET